LGLGVGWGWGWGWEWGWGWGWGPVGEFVRHGGLRGDAVVFQEQGRGKWGEQEAQQGPTNAPAA
jgi:hypothetical protein